MKAAQTVARNIDNASVARVANAVDGFKITRVHRTSYGVSLFVNNGRTASVVVHMFAGSGSTTVAPRDDDAQAKFHNWLTTQFN